MHQKNIDIENQLSKKIEGEEQLKNEYKYKISILETENNTMKIMNQESNNSIIDLKLLLETKTNDIQNIEYRLADIELY